MENPLVQDLDLVLSRTTPLWDDLRENRIFITGGTGFFGCWLLETFCHANRELSLKAKAVVLTRNPAAFEKKCQHLAGDSSITLTKGNIVDFDLPEGKFSHIIHAAADFGNKRTPIQEFESIVLGTRRVLELAKKAGAKKILLTSSGAVYGRQPPEIERISEEYAAGPNTMDPESAYGEWKRTAELLCATAARTHGFEAKIARCFAFIGPYLPLDRHFAAVSFIRDGLHGGPIRVTGDGSPSRSYLYAAELAEWLWTILFKGKNCCPYNVGSDEAVSIGDLAREVAMCFKKPTKIVIEKERDAVQPAERYVPSVKKIEKELQLKPSIRLKEAICRTIQWNIAIANREEKGKQACR